MSQQLVKKGTNGKHENVMPRSWIEAIKDKNTGQTLVEILQGFNMYFLPYNGNTSSTRNLVPMILRKKGLWITYVKYDGNVYTEWYGANEIDDKSWGSDSNWNVGSNTLVGDIAVSSDGYWVINGEKTTSKAQGERGIQPLLRVGSNNKLQVSYNLGQSYVDVTNNPVYIQYREYNNKLQVSNDLGSTWSDVSDYIASWFRWQATTGDTQANNVGRIQMSRDNGKTWTNMSNDFTNNLHISRYIGVNESLPTSGIAEGTIYAKGPYYAEGDTLNDNPIYRLWVYAWKDNTLAWQDNGEFQSIAAGVVQETGNSENAVMSQKVVSEKLSELGSEVDEIKAIKRNDRFYISKGGSVGYNESFDYALSDYFIVSDSVIIGRCKPTGNAPCLIGCVYDEDMNYIGDVTSDKNSVHNISLSDIEVPTNAKYMRANLLVGEGYIQGATFDSISTAFNVIGSRPTKKNFEDINSKIDKDIYGVYVERYKYIGVSSSLPIIKNTNSEDYSVTPFLRIKELSEFSIVCKPSSDLSFAGLYDKDYNPIDYIAHSNTGNVSFNSDKLAEEIANKGLTESAYYVVFCAAYSRTDDGKVYIPRRADVGLNKKVIELEGGLEEIKKNLYGVEVNRYSYIRSTNGLPKMYSTTVPEFSTTNYLEIKELNDFSIVCKPYGASPYTFVGLYDKDFNPIGCINFTDTNNVGEYTLSKLTNDIELQGFSENAYYVIFNIAYNYTNNGFINIAKKAEVKKTDDWWSNKDIYNYEKVLSMPKDVVKAMVETASNGRCTAIYDNDGYPSLMYKIPIISVGALEKKLGDFNTPHPAFIVNGEQKKHIYMSVFMSSSYNGHLVSWFGLSPVASLNITQLRNLSQGKGEGWHIETIYERSLLSLLARKFNSPNPKCNNYWGRSRNNEDGYLCAEMVNGGLPGQGLQSNGAKWINGSQPSEWSHNKQLWGIQDVCGGYHEIVDCVKVVDGFIYLCSDNDYSASEETWTNTGIAYDYIGGEIALNTRITSRTPSESTYVKKDIEDVILTSEYDLLSEDVRKKMVMLFISPKLKSNEEGLTLGTNGDVGVNNNVGVTGYMVMGGAEEYANCGYNYNVNSYDLSVITAHNNMGSRLCYIE